MVFNYFYHNIGNMYKLIYYLTQGFLQLLTNKGYDVTRLVPKSKEEIEFETHRLKLIDLQSEISIKRANIIGVQNEFINKVEPYLFQTLNNEKDQWAVNTGTKLWVDSITNIRQHINEHEEMILIFEKEYNQFTEKYNL